MSNLSPATATTIAMFCYAVGNVLLEQKLAGHHRLPLIICYVAVIGSLAFVTRQYGLSSGSPENLTFPVGASFVFILLVGVTFFFADYFYIGAYTSGGSIATITTISMLFPVFANVIKFVWTHKLPNRYQLMAYVLAVGAIWLAGKGNGK